MFTRKGPRHHHRDTAYSFSRILSVYIRLLIFSLAAVYYCLMRRDPAATTITRLGQFHSYSIYYKYAQLYMICCF
jgi:hypothetical protein